MVDDAQYPDGLFSGFKNVRRTTDVNSHELRELVDSVRTLENTVEELRKDIKILRGVLSEPA